MNHAIIKDPPDIMPGGIPLHLLKQPMKVDLAIDIRRSSNHPTNFVKYSRNSRRHPNAKLPDELFDNLQRIEARQTVEWNPAPQEQK